MVELLVMRHGKSAWDTGHHDHDRPLASRGERDALRMASWVVDNDVEPDLVISSPAERALRTATVVAHACGIDPTSIERQDELYLAEAEQWIETLRGQRDDRVLVVGHNPGLDDLVDYLSAKVVARSRSGKLMTTAAIAHLEFATGWAEIGLGRGRLVALVRPREL